MILRLLAGLLAVSYPLSAQMSGDAGGTKPDTVLTAASYVIHQEVDYAVSPDKLYEVLLSTKTFSAMTSTLPGFTKTSAKIDAKLGGASVLFDGHIVARNIELIPGKRIVQAWRVVTWPEGVWSTARFEFKQQGSGTHLVFDQTGFPPGLRDHLTAGWKEHYFDPLAKFVH